MLALASHTAALAIALSPLGALDAIAQEHAGAPLVQGEMLPTGQEIQPTGAPGSSFNPLVPIPSLPDFKAGQAVELAVSPDGAKLLVLTSGYNRTLGRDGKYLPARSNEYVFVYD